MDIKDMRIGKLYRAKYNRMNLMKVYLRHGDHTELTVGQSRLALGPTVTQKDLLLYFSKTLNSLGKPIPVFLTPSGKVGTCHATYVEEVKY